jgi:hypothetical protein
MLAHDRRNRCSFNYKNSLLRFSFEFEGLRFYFESKSFLTNDLFTHPIWDLNVDIRDRLYLVELNASASQSTMSAMTSTFSFRYRNSWRTTARSQVEIVNHRRPSFIVAKDSTYTTYILSSVHCLRSLSRLSDACFCANTRSETQIHWSDCLENTCSRARRRCRNIDEHCKSDFSSIRPSWSLD